VIRATRLEKKRDEAPRRAPVATGSAPVGPRLAIDVQFPALLPKAVCRSKQWLSSQHHQKVNLTDSLRTRNRPIPSVTFFSPPHRHASESRFRDEPCSPRRVFHAPSRAPLAPLGADARQLAEQKKTAPSRARPGVWSRSRRAPRGSNKAPPRAPRPREAPPRRPRTPRVCFRRRHPRRRRASRETRARRLRRWQNVRRAPSLRETN